MSKNRISQSGPAITSRAEMETLVGEITALTIKRDRETVRMDSEIDQIRKDYSPKIDELTSQIEGKVALAKEWAKAKENQTEFQGKKSIEFPQGTVGFRTGNPEFKLINGWKMAAVLEKLRALNLGGTYIRTVEEVNKELVVADRKTLGDEKLKSFGARVSQTVRFFVDPKREELSAPLKEAA